MLAAERLNSKCIKSIEKILGIEHLSDGMFQYTLTGSDEDLEMAQKADCAIAIISGWKKLLRTIINIEDTSAFFIDDYHCIIFPDSVVYRFRFSANWVKWLNESIGSMQH